MPMLEQRLQQQFFDSADLKYQAAETLSRALAEAAGTLLGAITGGGKLMVAGQGQAAFLAPHLASLLVGRFERERPPLPALALDTQPAAALAAVQALGHPGDVLLLVCNTATGPAAEADHETAQALVEAAQAQDMTVVLLAVSGTPAAGLPMGETDVAITLPPARAVRALELQLLVLHCLCDAIDLQLMGEQEP